MIPPPIAVDMLVNVDIWSDIVCPWCYLGKRRLEGALAAFEHADQVRVVWHSFELDPSAPVRRDGDMATRVARKYGISRDEALANQQRLSDLAAAEGLEYHLERTVAGNTFDAHRLLHLAAERDLQSALKERLMRAYFTEGRAIGDTGVLAELAGEVGLDRSEVEQVLQGPAFGDAVRADESMADEIGVSGVPFLVVDRRYAVAGAQPSDVMLDVLRRAWAARRSAETAPSDAAAC